jgi:hypothetical protein
MAAACLEDIRSSKEQASKRNGTILFTIILSRRNPSGAIESQVAENVSGNCLLDVLRINQVAFAGGADLFVLF